MNSDIKLEKGKSQVMLTIWCTAYNHEPYIRQCLEGFVMQKTTFRFEAIVHDDASTDETATIIREYAEKYPDIIRPILEMENQYSKKDGTIPKVMNENTHGRYVAFCEGDDYWTDPLKLQKQVDFLESHEDYSMCFHRAMLKWENGENKDTLFSKINDREYSGVEIFYRWIVPTASVVVRSEVLKSDIYNEVIVNPDILFGDTPLFLCAAHMGRIRGMKDVMSVYRKHEGGMVYSPNRERDLLMNKNNIAIYKIFGDKYKRAVVTRICKNNIYIYMQLPSIEKEQYRYLMWEAFRLDFIYSSVYYIYRYLKMLFG